MKMADLSDFKRGQIVSAHMAGARVTKTAELFGMARSSLDSNDSIWERRKNLHTEVKLWKKAKAVWFEPLDT